MSKPPEEKPWKENSIVASRPANERKSTTPEGIPSGE
jgi:hypothetical protein